ncbi:hypothetical protein LSM04_007782 [Trypanosoma melophagium]|uniref:uncharacterized protein n=1 Tax=Trypanosoma melophagium TaxID=715481 RepID=UPI00351A6762|nr:hypothetical protein LSM04_007782 [Trypanosoma melophagium]
MTPESHSKRQSSLFSYLRAALAPSSKGDDIESFHVTSPHIRSDPVPAGFRKQTPLPSAREEVCRCISIQSRCSSAGNTNNSNKFVPAGEHDELTRSAVNKLRLLHCDQLNLLQLSLSVPAPLPSLNEGSEESEWCGGSMAERTSAVLLQDQTPIDIPDCSKMDIVEHWLEEQASTQCDKVN